MDIKRMFFEETIYMAQPNQTTMSMMCKLKKSIYRLKHAFCHWCYKFHNVIDSFSLESNIVDECRCLKFCGSKIVFLVIYVDDILLTSNDINMLQQTKNFLIRNFCGKKDLSDASFEIKRYWDILGLSKRKLHR
jgi:hypothetical protein